MRAKRVEKLCTIPNHIPGDIHSTQTSRLNAEVDRLKAENQALRAIIGLQADEKNETLRVLSDLAAAFQIGEAAGWPGASSTPIDAERVTGGHPSSKPPQAGDRAARQTVYMLQKRILETVDWFHTRMENSWKSPTYDL